MRALTPANYTKRATWSRRWIKELIKNSEILLDEGSQFSDLARQVVEATSQSQLTDIFQKAIERLGYSKFAYHVVCSPALINETNRSSLGLTSYSDKWLKHYRDYGYVNQDPVVDRVMSQKQAFRWSDAFRDAKFDRRQTEVMGDARDAGIFDGVTVPLKSRNGEQAGFTFIAKEGSEVEADRPIGLECLLAEFLHGQALEFILCAEYQRNSRRKTSILSPRETQVLTWAARGKSSWEMSQILEIAEKSVEFYIDSAKRKMMASNRTHAVVKAMMLGLIE
ncbi:helix-turn-helix transcriptional regulator [Palleronia caenipelagi]|uniref:helix-turn-helix transcriptional regulator n=1 Tax=Palleronia caenipelagi TaxID=2489174 RepID=UPI00163D5689|nr:LuxR family transcriptional regulator [Palleronia caenipelagi]